MENNKKSVESNNIVENVLLLNSEGVNANKISQYLGIFRQQVVRIIDNNAPLTEREKSFLSEKMFFEGMLQNANELLKKSYDIIISQQKLLDDYSTKTEKCFEIFNNLDDIVQKHENQINLLIKQSENFSDEVAKEFSQLRGIVENAYEHIEKIRKYPDKLNKALDDKLKEYKTLPEIHTKMIAYDIIENASKQIINAYEKGYVEKAIDRMINKAFQDKQNEQLFKAMTKEEYATTLIEAGLHLCEQFNLNEQDVLTEIKESPKKRAFFGAFRRK